MAHFLFQVFYSTIMEVSKILAMVSEKYPTPMPFSSIPYSHYSPPSLFFLYIY